MKKAMLVEGAAWISIVMASVALSGCIRGEGTFEGAELDETESTELALGIEDCQLDPDNLVQNCSVEAQSLAEGQWKAPSKWWVDNAVAFNPKSSQGAAVVGSNVLATGNSARTGIACQNVYGNIVAGDTFTAEAYGNPRLDGPGSAPGRVFLQAKPHIALSPLSPTLLCSADVEAGSLLPGACSAVAGASVAGHWLQLCVETTAKGQMLFDNVAATTDGLMPSGGQAPSTCQDAANLVQDCSFESLAVADGTYGVIPDDYHRVDYNSSVLASGTWNPPESWGLETRGSNVMLMGNLAGGGEVCQTVVEGASAGATLSAEALVAQRADVENGGAPSFSYRFGLRRVGGPELCVVTEADVTPRPYGYLPVSCSYVTEAADAGADIEVCMIADGSAPGSTIFDELRVTFAP